MGRCKGEEGYEDGGYLEDHGKLGCNEDFSLRGRNVSKSVTLDIGWWVEYLMMLTYNN